VSAATARITHSMLAHGLTERQQQIAWMYIVGVSRHAIADQLFLSPSTVSGHLSRVFAAYGVDGRQSHGLLRLLRLMLGLPADDLSQAAQWADDLVQAHLRGWESHWRDAA
jgi:DNA-binding CsgD family transcriptional regulator